MKRSIVFALVLFVFFATPVAAQSNVESRVQHIASQLQCPVCDNESVADSPSDLAAEMRQLIHEKVKQGQSDQQILNYFVDQYGEKILLDPPKQGFGLLAWAQPVLVVLIGALLVAFGISRWTRSRNSSDDVALVSEEDMKRYGDQLTEELGQYTKRSG